MSSGPNPIYVDFVVRHMDDVLKSIKTIADAVQKVSHKSVAAVKATAAAQTAEEKKANREREREYRAFVKHVDGIKERSASYAGKYAAKEAANESKEREKAYREFVRRVDGIKERSASYAGKFAAKEAANEAKEREKAYKDFAKRVDGIKERSTSYAGKFASKQAADEAVTAKQLAVERRKAQLALVRGEHLEPGTAAHLSPQSRLLVLKQAQGKSLEEQRAAIARVQDMAAEASARRAGFKKGHVPDRTDHGYLAKEIEKQEKREATAVQRAADKRIRAQNYVQRIRDRYEAQEARQREKQERELAAKRERFHRVIGNGISSVANRGAAIMGAVTRSVLDTGGGFSVQGAIQDRVSLEREAVRFSNNAFQARPGEKRMLSKDILAKTRANAIATGTDEVELLQGANAYGAKSGDYAGGLQLQNFFGKVAKGTGASVSDVARTAGILKVQNKDLGEKEMKALILNTIRQGQAGSVEFSDLARVAGNFTRSSAGYAGDQGKIQGKLLGLGQIAMRTAGRDPREAATVLSSLESDAGKHKDSIEGLLGKGVYDSAGKIAGAKGQYKNAPEKFYADLMYKTGGNVNKLSGIGFNAHSRKFFQALSSPFDKAKEGALAKGASADDANKAGRDAILTEMKSLTDASMTAEELDKNVAEIMKTSAEQFEGAVREFKMMVGEELVPALKELIPMMKEFMPAARMFFSAIASLSKLLNPGSPDDDVNAGLRATNALATGVHNKEELDEQRAAAAELGESIEKKKKANKGGSLFYGAELMVAGAKDVATAGFGHSATADVVKEHKRQKALAQQNIDEASVKFDLLNKNIAKASEQLAKLGEHGGAPAASTANPANPSRGLPLGRR